MSQAAVYDDALRDLDVVSDCDECACRCDCDCDEEGECGEFLPRRPCADDDVSMAMKQLARRLQPLPLYLIVFLTVCLALVQLSVAHVTHSLTLLLDSYLAITNIIVVVGSIISTTYGSGRSGRDASTVNSSLEELKSLASLTGRKQMDADKAGPERRLRNTFGWARVDVLVTLVASVFQASFCFSLVMEALQTLAHISHHDEMHLAVPVAATGFAALALDLLAYAMIGGYTFNHGSFLMKSSESVETVESSNSANLNLPRKEDPSLKTEMKVPKRQGFRGLSRDCVCSVFVIVCAILVHCTERQVAKFIDPSMSIASALLVFYLSLPYLTDSCKILLQTIPGHIDISSLCTELSQAFPDVVNVHELHVWELAIGKIYCTAHIIFLNPKEYLRITDQVTSFFLGKGITYVTIQPEFYKEASKSDIGGSGGDCLVQCTEDLCMEKHCCASRTPSLESVHVHECKAHTHFHNHSHGRKHKSPAKPKSSKCEKSFAEKVPQMVEKEVSLTVAQSQDVAQDQNNDPKQKEELNSAEEEESKDSRNLVQQEKPVNHDEGPAKL